jgi:formylmethanofuran dehydrogenase subunit E
MLDGPRPRGRRLDVIVVAVLAACTSSAPRGPDGPSGSGQPQVTSAWYYPAWLDEAPHAPAFEVRDTVNKYGRYASQTKRITLGDLIRFHGHFCGGLVEAAVTLRVAFDALFPDGVIDRTELQVASNNSACGGDVAAYVTGARTRFGSHFIDPALQESEFVVRRISTGEAVRVHINAATYPADVRAQMRRIESGHSSEEELLRFQTLQWAYARKLVSQPAAASTVVVDAAAYVWPEPPCKDFGRRRDNDFK